MILVEEGKKIVKYSLVSIELVEGFFLHGDFFFSDGSFQRR